MEHESPTARLDRLRHWAVQGRRAEAELELHEWARQDGPATARALLARLLTRRGEQDAALQILGNPARPLAPAPGSQSTPGSQGNDSSRGSNPPSHRDTAPPAPGQPMDPDHAELAVSILLAAGRDDEARRLGAWLYHEHGHEPRVARFVTSLDLPGLASLPAVADDTARRMADELAAQPEVVPSLVYALKHAPQLRDISLLRAATKKLTQTWADAPEMPRLAQALAELAMLVGDEDDARQWAHRGLRLEPFNASLALLLGRIKDDEAVGPPAAETLKRVALKFPGYPDVQRAYAQRVEADRQQGKVA